MLAALTARERAVALLYADGCSRKEVARRLRIGPGTVRSHLDAIFRKLQVHSRLALHRLLAAGAGAVLPASIARDVRVLPPLVLEPGAQSAPGRSGTQEEGAAGPPPGGEFRPDTARGTDASTGTGPDPGVTCRVEVVVELHAPERCRDDAGAAGEGARDPRPCGASRAGGLAVLFDDGRGNPAAALDACTRSGVLDRIVAVAADGTRIVCHLRTADGWTTVHPAPGAGLVLEDGALRITVTVRRGESGR